MARLRRSASTLRLRHPAPTLRLRLAALYGALFLLTGGALLTLGYLLVRHNLDSGLGTRAALARLGFPVPRRPVFPESQLVEAVRAQLRAQALHRLLLEYVAALVVMTAASTAGAWWLAGRALRPLRRIIATAQRVSSENLGERIDLEGPPDELQELAQTFDGMLERLDTAFASQRHFVANASHELRTPLAIMRAELDVALDDPHGGEADVRRMAEGLQETIDRCERLIEGLLMLARSEAATGREEPVNLGELAGDCVTDLSARAREADVQLREHLPAAWTSGDPALLERMVANLVDNAIRYNQPGGFVEVRTWVEGSQARLEVANSGAVIPAGDAARLTQPFQRLNRTPGGFGLGLSIVASVARAHHGSVEIAPRNEGGLKVAVTLPVVRRPTALSASKESSALTRS